VAFVNNKSIGLTCKCDALYRTVGVCALDLSKGSTEVYYNNIDVLSAINTPSSCQNLERSLCRLNLLHASECVKIVEPPMT
jgi:hypothetical protein